MLTERGQNKAIAIASDESFGKAHMFRRTCARQRRDFTGVQVPMAPRILHDRPVLIELVKVAMFPGTSWLADVRTAFGHTAVRWCGDRTAKPGEYHVEWTIDEDIAWGRNAKSAAGIGPGLWTGGHCVVVRGQLSLTEDGAAMLDLNGATILLGLADPLPDGVVGTWVELFIEREKIAVYPYEL